MIGDKEPASAGSRPLGLEVVHPCWLIAVGDTERVEVMRGSSLRTDDAWLEPVQQYISDNGLVLAVQESFEDDDFMGGEVEVSVYVPPAVRNGVLAGTAISLPWHAASALVEA